LVARALHHNSPRRERPLVTINCAALQENLLESEVFGHEKGAFTGAVQAKPGLVEVAEGGTLFIDEIGEMAPGLQAKLLRVLEDGHYRRVGGTQENRADVRVVAATNRPLEEEIKVGRFREDLFYRLNVLSIDLPPLRERAQDIPELVEHFLTTRQIGPTPATGSSPRPWRSCAATTGRATSASWPTSSSAPRSWPSTTSSRPTTCPRS
jgi:transcriptional regulator with PAS, ATPase and Fis domain